MRPCCFDAAATMVKGIHIPEPDRDSAARDEPMLWVLQCLTGGARDRVVHHRIGEDA